MIQAHDPAHEITPKYEAIDKAINLISTHAARVHKHGYYISLAPRNQATNTNRKLSNSKYAYLLSQMPINTSFAGRNTIYCKQSFQNWNERYLAERETQFTKSNFPPIRQHSTNKSKSHNPKLASVLFALNHSANHLTSSPSTKFSKLNHKVDINHINTTTYKMSSKKRITRVRFNDASQSAISLSTSVTSFRAANQATNSANATRAANQQLTPPNAIRAANPLFISTPTSPALSSNISTPLTPSPQVPTFDQIFSKIFSKSLIASLTSKDALLKEVRACILINNESCLKALNPYIHSYWRDFQVRSGCVCVDENLAIPNVLREALIEDIHASHPGTWGMICMAMHCWWPYMNRELVVKETERKSRTAVCRNLKSVIPAKHFKTHIPCVEPDQELQIDFGGPIFDEKGAEVYFLTAIDRFSKYPTACIYEKANGPNVLNFLDMYIKNHGIPHSIRLDQAKCLVGNQVKTFCNKNNIQIIEAPGNDHRAIGLMERLIQTIKNRLASIKKEKSVNNTFHVRHALKIIIDQLRI